MGHSAAAVYVENGIIKCAIEEEKLNRVKGFVGFPFKSIQYIYDAYKLKPDVVDEIAFGFSDICEFSYSARNLNRYFKKQSVLDKFQANITDALKIIFFPFERYFSALIRRKFYRYLREIGYDKGKIRLVDHHTCHAASAYYTSPWDNSLIVTCDGKGDGKSAAVFIGEKNNLTEIDFVLQDDSLGQIYQVVTKYLGFRINRHEGKITGLAAYGDPGKTVENYSKVFQIKNGKYKNKLYDIDEFRANSFSYYKNNVKDKSFISIRYLRALYGRLPQYAMMYQMLLNFLKETFKGVSKEDVSAGLQEFVENAITTYIQNVYEKNNIKTGNICLAGGFFANVKANQRINEMGFINNLFVHPAMDDSGTALGAALFSFYSKNNKRWKKLNNAYLGPEFTDDEIKAALIKENLSFIQPEDPEDYIGELIYEGKIIGRFNGRLEWGPRALGNRSIIARPTDKAINDTLNARLKRTEFMPFAPSIIEDDAEDYLVNYNRDNIAANYMTVTYPVCASKVEKIQATVHIDNTARPQVVRKEQNESFYKIIDSYKKRSGIGVVINTSFNMHEEPIVASPYDAIRAFRQGAVDVLSIGPYVVE